MNEFVIFVDSCSDLSKELATKIDVISLPLTFHISGIDYQNDLEEKEITILEVYRRLRNGESATTSQINPDVFYKKFKEILNQGKDILYLAFSSGLSGTYNSSLIAVDMLKEEFPQRKILCVDTLSASLGLGLFVYDVANMRLDGLSLEQCYHYAEEHKLNYCHLFTVDDLYFLKRGGRLSASSAFLGTLLKLKPILHVSNEGKLVPIGKVLGRRNSLKVLVNRMLEITPDLSKQVIFISHGDCQEDLNYVISLIKEKANPKQIITNLVGPVVGSHSGPGTMAIFFKGHKR